MNGDARGQRGLSIGEAERRTGLAKDTLRVWERRYGFPTPVRAGGANRSYPSDQVEKLIVIRRLLDLGHRPAKLVGQTLEALLALEQDQGRGKVGAAETEAFGALAVGDAQGFRRSLSQALVRQGLERFVLDILAPLATQVGDAWSQGRLPIYAEHIFTEQVSRVLRAALEDLPQPAADARPRVLLGTLPGEAHTLGLLMAEAMLALEDAACLSLGPDTPPGEIAAAAAAHHSQVIALSFSAHTGREDARVSLQALRSAVPQAVEIWAGGAGSESLACEAVRVVPRLADVAQAVQDWRERRGSS